MSGVSRKKKKLVCHRKIVLFNSVLLTSFHPLCLTPLHSVREAEDSFLG